MPQLTKDIMTIYVRDVDTKSLLDMGEAFPDDVTVIRFLNTNPALHVCYDWQGVSGLACFSNKMFASMFMAMVLEDAMGKVDYDAITLNEALDLAKSKPAPITALLLFDNLSNPGIMYVK